MNRLKAFIIGWTKNWSDRNQDSILESQGDDLFKEFVMLSSKTFQRNKEIAENFGIIITQVKCFPTDSGWMVIDKHTKHLLAKELKESEVEPLCRKMNYTR
jgi:hypothetical protein